MAIERGYVPLPDFQGAARHIEALALEVGRWENVPGMRERRRFEEAVLRERTRSDEAYQWQRQQFDWQRHQLDLQRQQLEAQDEKLNATVISLAQTAQQMHKSFESLICILHANSANSAAGVINSTLINPEPMSSLAAFMNTTTNKPIMGFPATFRDWQEMTEDKLDQTLSELGLEVGGDIETKRMHFGMHIGLHRSFLDSHFLDLVFT